MENWTEIVDRHGTIVVRAAMRILGSESDAEDVAQEAFLQAFQLWKQQSIENWPALLRKIATRRAIDRLRGRRSVDSLESDPPSHSGPPDATLETQELKQRLRIELAKLPEQQAEIFAMRYFEELSNHQIATALDISTSGVSSALTKARNTLSNRLSDLRCGGAR